MPETYISDFSFPCLTFSLKKSGVDYQEKKQIGHRTWEQQVSRHAISFFPASHHKVESGTIQGKNTMVTW